MRAKKKTKRKYAVKCGPAGAVSLGPAIMAVFPGNLEISSSLSLNLTPNDAADNSEPGGTTEFVGFVVLSKSGLMAFEGASEPGGTTELAVFVVCRRCCSPSSSSSSSVLSENAVDERPVTLSSTNVACALLSFEGTQSRCGLLAFEEALS